MDKGPSNIFLFNIVKPDPGSQAAAAESGLAAATRVTCPGPRVPRPGMVRTRVGTAASLQWAGRGRGPASNLSPILDPASPPSLLICGTIAGDHIWVVTAVTPTVLHWSSGSPGTRSHEDWVQWVLQLSHYSHSHIFTVHIVILVILRTERGCHEAMRSQGRGLGRAGLQVSPHYRRGIPSRIPAQQKLISGAN